MAFSKIAGFDVTPRKSSPATFCWRFEVAPFVRPIFCWRSPLVINARRTLSYQMLCPSLCSSIKGLSLICPFRPLHRLARSHRHILHGETEMLQQLFQRSRSAELATRDDATVDSYVPSPTEARACFNSNT